MIAVGALVVGILIGYGSFMMRTNSTLYASKCVSPAEMNTYQGMMGHEMDSMEHEMMTMTDRMKSKTGDELDQIFLQDMIVHHQGAVEMAQILIKETKRPELQKMGADIIRVQTTEIAQMQQWLDMWFK